MHGKIGHTMQRRVRRESDGALPGNAASFIPRKVTLSAKHVRPEKEKFSQSKLNCSANCYELLGLGLEDKSASVAWNHGASRVVESGVDVVFFGPWLLHIGDLPRESFRDGDILEKEKIGWLGEHPITHHKIKAM